MHLLAVDPPTMDSSPLVHALRQIISETAEDRKRADQFFREVFFHLSLLPNVVAHHAPHRLLFVLDNLRSCALMRRTLRENVCVCAAPFYNYCDDLSLEAGTQANRCIERQLFSMGNRISL